MKPLKILIILFFIIAFLLAYMNKELTIAKIWSSYHINSIIGLQKFIETITINEKHNLDIWYTIIFPIINNSIFHNFIIIVFITFILIKIKNKF